MTAAKQAESHGLNRHWLRGQTLDGRFASRRWTCVPPTTTTVLDITWILTVFRLLCKHVCTSAGGWRCLTARGKVEKGRFVSCLRRDRKISRASTPQAPGWHRIFFGLAVNVSSATWVRVVPSQTLVGSNAVVWRRSRLSCDHRSWRLLPPTAASARGRL